MLRCHAPGARHIGCRIGKRTDKGNRSLFVERKQPLLVLEQDERFCGNPSCGSPVLGAIYLRFSLTFLAVAVRVLEQTELVLCLENSPAGGIEGLLAYASVLETLLYIGKESFTDHIHIDPGVEGALGHFFERSDAVVNEFEYAGVVGNHKTVKSPLVPENVGKQPLVCSGRGAVDFVERHHCAAGSCIECRLVR